MQKDNSKKAFSFDVSLFAVTDVKGIMRNSKGPPWNNSPWITEQLNKTVYGKMTLMGSTTYKSFVEHADKTNNFLLKDTSITFVISKKSKSEIKEEHMAYKIHSLDIIPSIYYVMKENVKKVNEAVVKECIKERRLTTNKEKKEEFVQLMQLIKGRPMPIAPEIVVLGGISLYKEMLDYARIIYTIQFHDEFDGDERFPLFFNQDEWKLSHAADSSEKREDRHCKYTFIAYRRKNQPKKYLSFFKPRPRLKSPQKPDIIET